MLVFLSFIQQPWYHFCTDLPHLEIFYDDPPYSLTIYTQLICYHSNRHSLRCIYFIPLLVGVPQGSSLSPMFFLIYINDLHNSLESEPRLFADNTCLLVKGLNFEQLEINLNTELHHLHLWCNVNKLSINPAKLSVNPAKTNIVIIPLKRIKTPISHLNISSNGTPVSIVSCAKYLGVIIDNELNFHEQIKVM